MESRKTRTPIYSKAFQKEGQLRQYSILMGCHFKFKMSNKALFGAIRSCDTRCFWNFKFKMSNKALFGGTNEWVSYALHGLVLHFHHLKCTNRYLILRTVSDSRAACTNTFFSTSDDNFLVDRKLRRKLSMFLPSRVAI